MPEQLEDEGVTVHPAQLKVEEEVTVHPAPPHLVVLPVNHVIPVTWQSTKAEN